MKKISVFLLFAISSILSLTACGKTGATIINSMTLGGNSDVYLAGYKTGADGYDSKAVVFRYSSADGKLIWSKNIIENGTSKITCVRADSQNNIIIAGRTSGNFIDDKSVTGAGLFIAKLSSTDGSLAWAKVLPTGEATESFSDMTVNTSSNLDDIYLTGVTSGYLEGLTNEGQYASGSDILILKLDRNGEEKWIKQYGTLEEQERGIKIFFNNNSLSVLGTNAKDILLVNYDADGNLLSEKQLDSSIDAFTGASMINDQFFLLGFDSFATDEQILTVNTDLSLAMNWEKDYGTNRIDEGLDIVNDKEGDFIITGYTTGSYGAANAGSTDAFLAKFDNSGNEIWKTQFGTKDLETGTVLSVDEDSNIYLVGINSNADGLSYDGVPPSGNGYTTKFYLRKYDLDGNMLWEALE